jgi:hypothetical protein
MMTCMDRHETSSTLHSMISIVSTLPHLVSLVAPSLFSHFTPCLSHQPRVNAQSSVPISSAHSSHKQCLCVPCPSCDHLYIIRVSLTHHWTSCTAHKQSSTSKVLMLSTLSCSLPFSTWTWIVSLDIINAFYLSLPRPHSYHHIPYVVTYVNVMESFIWIFIHVFNF